MLEILLLFDENKEVPSLSKILLYTVIIIVASNIVFMAFCFILGIDPAKQIEKEKQVEYKEWKEKGLSVTSLAISELFNTVIYSPTVEELLFRVLLMKFILVRYFKISYWVANGIQSIAFGSLHLTNNIYSTQTTKYTSLQTLSATISGFISGWAYIQSNSVLPCLFSHILNNGTASFSEVIGYYNYLKNNK